MTQIFDCHRKAFCVLGPNLNSCPLRGKKNSKEKWGKCFQIHTGQRFVQETLLWCFMELKKCKIVIKPWQTGWMLELVGLAEREHQNILQTDRKCKTREAWVCESLLHCFYWERNLCFTGTGRNTVLPLVHTASLHWYIVVASLANFSLFTKNSSGHWGFQGFFQGSVPMDKE